MSRGCLALTLQLLVLGGSIAFGTVLPAAFPRAAGNDCRPLEENDGIVFPQGTVPIRLYETNKGGRIGTVAAADIADISGEIEICSELASVSAIRLPSDTKIRFDQGKHGTAGNIYWVRSNQVRISSPDRVAEKRFLCERNQVKTRTGGAASGAETCNGGGGGSVLQRSPAGLRHTGRDLLFAGEAERLGHPLYSYLLYAGASTGASEERARFRAAIKAFVGRFRSASSLEKSGSTQSEVNIFYAPAIPLFADASPEEMRQRFADVTVEGQVSLLLEHYDHARAEVLLSRIEILGNGPYIVSLLRPLTREAVRADEALLVQDLSGVPPQLVGLWVDEFKRQVVREATGSPEHLRRFALSLRTQVAVLAEAFSITRAAVAEMFEEPRVGNGN